MLRIIMLLLVLAAGASTGTQQTTLWSDSPRRGDTTFFGSGRVVTTNVVYLDSQWVRVPDPPPLRTGIPLGLFGSWSGTTLEPNTEVFTMTYGGVTPATLLARLVVARAKGLRMVIAM